MHQTVLADAMWNFESRALPLERAELTLKKIDILPRVGAPDKTGITKVCGEICCFFFFCESSELRYGSISYYSKIT
ncbi:hypothetical protein Y032_0232g3046 [Ancylostoma ceylanicum]|uniref:Uncharacterized protein n=1 Tax=Ancylostoma ceylanicum TaxID=53326 RepID=A0A016SFP0_9BILA|nr:hypothetical protein Y032_0232g3046 [Ancylostoma ceylanicum]